MNRRTALRTILGTAVAAAGGALALSCAGLPRHKAVVSDYGGGGPTQKMATQRMTVEYLVELERYCVENLRMGPCDKVFCNGGIIAYPRG